MEFLQMPFFIYQILVCLLLSFFFLGKGTKAEKILPVFFLALLCLEYYCAYLDKRNYKTNAIYNFWFPIEYAFYGFFIQTYIVDIKKKKIAGALILSYLLFTIIFYSLQTDLSKFSSLDYLLGFLALLIIVLFKLYEILNQEIIHNPLKNQIFWVIVGLLLINLGSFFHFGAVNYLYKNNKQLHSALQQLNVYLTEFQYFCFIVYFYCRWKFQKSHI